MSFKNQNFSFQIKLNDFLSNLNYDVICSLPFDNDPRRVAAHVRNGTSFQILTGEILFGWNVRNEAQRLQLNDQYVINAATNQIWKLKSTPSQRRQFTSLSNDANFINQNVRQAIDDTLYRIAQMDTPQVTNNLLANNFYNGTDFGGQ